MNVLFSYIADNHNQRAIANILQSIDDIKIYLEQTTPTLEDSNNIPFDIIIAYKRLGLQQILPFARQKRVPIIYVTDGNEMITAYPDITSIAKIVVVEDINAVPMKMLRKDLIHVIPILPPLHFSSETQSTSKKKASEEKKRLLIDISRFNLKYTSVVYQLIPLCNILINIDITILYDETPLLPFFNTNITVLNKNMVLIEEIIAKSDMVIGNGDAIIRSVVAGKPCVVIGEQGYGGIVTSQNLKIYYQNNFQGRIGGYLDEYIPEHILQDDIQSLTTLDIEKRKELVEGNKKTLSDIYKELTKSWKNVLIETIQQENQLINNLSDCTLQLSPDLALLPFPDEKFALTYKATRQVHSNLEKEEAAIIMLFNEPVKVKKALKKSDYKEEATMFMEFIQMLVIEKILMPYGK